MKQNSVNDVSLAGDDILFFSRGKGRGHAFPDASVASALLALKPELKLRFVSYGLGLTTLNELGWSPLDLKVSENAPLWDVAVAALRILQNHRPRFIVAHEEFAILPISRALGIPNILTTDWLPRLETPAMQCITYSDAIAFMDEVGFYEIPPHLIERTSFVGTVLRPIKLSVDSRPSTRSSLEIPADAFVLLCAPGAGMQHSEREAPIFELILNSFCKLPFKSKRLLWLVGPDENERLEGLCRDHGNVTFLTPHKEFLQTIYASDLLITKGNRMTVLEAAALGIRSISLSYGHNPIDDYRISRVKSNIALRAKGLDADTLSHFIVQSTLEKPACLPTSDVGSSVIKLAAFILERYLSNENVSLTA